MRLEPALRSVLLDRRSERLAELAVVFYVELLVRQLVKQQARDILLAAADHRAQHRVGEVPERRVRARAAAVGVVTLVDELLLKFFGVCAIEKPAVRDAARERETPTLGLDRKLLRGDDIPNDVRPLEVDVASCSCRYREARARPRRICESRRPRRATTSSSDRARGPRVASRSAFACAGARAARRSPASRTAARSPRAHADAAAIARPRPQALQTLPIPKIRR